jgi:hypothetical protein
LKSHFWSHPEYRKSITSKDIYEAVLDEGVTDIAGFESYLENKSA